MVKMAKSKKIVEEKIEEPLAQENEVPNPPLKKVNRRSRIAVTEDKLAELEGVFHF